MLTLLPNSVSAAASPALIRLYTALPTSTVFEKKVSIHAENIYRHAACAIAADSWGGGRARMVMAPVACFCRCLKIMPGDDAWVVKSCRRQRNKRLIDPRASNSLCSFGIHHHPDSPDEAQWSSSIDQQCRVVLNCEDMTSSGLHLRAGCECICMYLHYFFYHYENAGQREICLLPRSAPDGGQGNKTLFGKESTSWHRTNASDDDLSY